MKWICFGKKNRQPFRLTREAFEADTLSKPPFTFNYRNYAVCPACLNAVQILGIRTELKNTPDPYAKHTLAEIPELDAIQDEIAYRNCPYSDPESKPKNCRYTNRTPGIISSMVIELFWTQLDRIFYILERDLPFKLSWQAKETILKDFVGYRGWLHPEISLLNAPWMLLYCSNFHSLWKCELKDGDLREKIKKIKGVEFNERNENIIEHDGFSSLGFCAIHHRSYSTGKDVRETIKFIVAKKMDCWFKKEIASETFPSNEILFSKTLEIKPDYFYNLTHSSNPQFENTHLQSLRRNLYLLDRVKFPPRSS